MFRNRESVFLLTETESKLLSLVRSGLTAGEAARSLGAPKGTGACVAVAAEKERLQILLRLDRTRPSVGVTLGHARGDRRIVGAPDVRRGKWKRV